MIWNMKNPEITRKKMDRGMSRLKMKEYINCETEGLIRLVCGCGDEKGREKQLWEKSTKTTGQSTLHLTTSLSAWHVKGDQRCKRKEVEEEARC